MATIYSKCNEHNIEKIDENLSERKNNSKFKRTGEIQMAE